MTTENEQIQVAEVTVAAWEAAAYIQLAIPGVPYSAIRVPLPADPVEAAKWTDRALKTALYLSRKFREAFPEPEPEAPQRPQERAQRPQNSGAVSQAGPPRRAGRRSTGHFSPPPPLLIF